jgi:hypothetical protein
MTNTAELSFPAAQHWYLPWPVLLPPLAPMASIRHRASKNPMATLLKLRFRLDAFFLSSIISAPWVLSPISPVYEHDLTVQAVLFQTVFSAEKGVKRGEQGIFKKIQDLEYCLPINTIG